MHTIPGIADARGVVGSPLTQMASRVYIAGLLRNSRIISRYGSESRRGIRPGNAMPNMGITAPAARDIVAYLATLR